MMMRRRRMLQNYNFFFDTILEGAGLEEEGAMALSLFLQLWEPAGGTT